MIINVNLILINKGFDVVIRFPQKCISKWEEVNVRSAVFQEYHAHLMEGRKFLMKRFWARVDFMCV